MDLTLILPVKNERENLVPLLQEIEQVLDAWGRSYEVIAVDDGSDDGSADLLRELVRSKPYLRLLVFRTNQGQAAAFDAGFRHASGDIVATMDADMQNDPRDLPRMIGVLESGYDFVTGNRRDRKDDYLLRRLPSKVANFLIRRITHTKLKDLGCSLKVYRREITDELRLYGEMHRFVGVLAESIGARTAELDVQHRRRHAGTSKYGLTRTFKVLLDLLTVWFMRGYQTKPIYVFGGVAFGLMSGAVLLSGFVLYEKLALDIFVHRNPLFILSMIMFIVGVQFMALGLIAEIIVRTYFESQSRPPYLIAAKAGFPATPHFTSDAAGV